MLCHLFFNSLLNFRSKIVAPEFPNENPSGVIITQLQSKVAFLCGELDAKIADIQLLQDSMQKKDNVLQDRTVMCDSLRSQIQLMESSERHLQLQLEELSQQEKRRRVDLEDNIEDLKRICEDQSREIFVLKSSSEPAKESDNTSSDENVNLSAEVLALSDELRRKSDLLESQKSKYQSLKGSLHDKEDKLLQCEQDRKHLKAQLDDAARECDRKCALLNDDLLSVHSELKVAQEVSKVMKKQLETAENVRRK